MLKIHKPNGSLCWIISSRPSDLWNKQAEPFPDLLTRTGSVFCCHECLTAALYTMSNIQNTRSVRINTLHLKTLSSDGSKELLIIKKSVQLMEICHGNTPFDCVVFSLHLSFCLRDHVNIFLWKNDYFLYQLISRLFSRLNRFSVSARVREMWENGDKCP